MPGHDSFLCHRKSSERARVNGIKFPGLPLPRHQPRNLLHLEVCFQSLPSATLCLFLTPTFPEQHLHNAAHQAPHPRRRSRRDLNGCPDRQQLLARREQSRFSLEDNRMPSPSSSLISQCPLTFPSDQVRRWARPGPGALPALQARRGRDLLPARLVSYLPFTPSPLHARLFANLRSLALTSPPRPAKSISRLRASTAGSIGMSLPLLFLRIDMGHPTDLSG